MPRKLILVSTVALVASLVAVQDVAADSPDRKNPVSGQEIINIYNGKTWVWRRGGSYWGGGGHFEAIYDDRAVAVGRWYPTTRGSLCYEAGWKAERGGGVKNMKRCWKHVKDSEGVLWKQDPETKEWYKAANEMAERIKSGNVIKSEVQRRRLNVGL